MYIPTTHDEYVKFTRDYRLDPTSRIRARWTHMEALTTCQDALATAAFVESNSYANYDYNGDKIIYMAAVRMSARSTERSRYIAEDTMDWSYSS